MPRWILMILMAAGAACSVPDDPNYEAVRSGIAHLPMSTQQEGRRWAANDKAWRYFASEDADQLLMTVTCKDASGSERVDKILVETMVECLGAAMAEVTDQGLRKVLTFGDCIDTIVNGTRSRLVGTAGEGFGEIKCSHEFAPLYELDVQDPSWDPAHESNDDVTRALISADKLPAWLPFAVIGGVAVFTLLPELLPALCTLSDGNGPACPSNPNYPVGQTPQPDRGAP